MGIRAGWFLGNVVVLVPAHGKQYMFPVNRWLCRDECDGKVEVEVYASEVIDIEKCKIKPRGVITDHGARGKILTDRA